MIGSRQWRAAWTAAALVVAVVLALPALAVAEATPAAAGAATGSLGDSGEALSYWTPARLEAAEPLPIVTVPGAPPGGQASARAAAVGSRAVARAAAVQGTPVDTAESTAYPNSVNGKVFGVFETHPILGEVKIEKYVCSGSVVASPGGDVVLTAGHCVIDPETGAKARNVIFIPGYRDCSDPFGAWEAVAYATTETWKKSVGPFSKANEGGDLALLLLHEDEAGESVEDVVGSFGIEFEQPAEQTYTQYGYPAEQPYDGEALYRHEAPYVGRDDSLCGVIWKRPCYEPEPIKIASDFTQGASGGPWTVGPAESPTVLSLTAYGYEDQPGYLYGPYFGAEAEAAYETVSETTSGPAAAPQVSATCRVRPRATTSTPSSSGGAATGSPPPATAPPTTAPTLRVKKIRRRADGSAVVVAKVGGAGRLKLTGATVRADSLHVPAAGRYRLEVAPKKAAGRRLRRRGRATVRVRIAFSAAGTTRRLTKRIRLRRRSLTRRIAHHTAARRD